MANAVQFAEERMQLRQTRALVARYGIDIALLRGGEPVSDGAGGSVRSGALPIRTQRLFFSGLTGRGYTYSIHAGTGDKLVTEFVLIGLVGSDIQKDDEFVIANRRFKVEYVYPDFRFQVKANVVAVERSG